MQDNAAIVRAELRNFDEHFDLNSGQLNRAIPYPYTVSLLSIAWRMVLEYKAYLSSYSFSNRLIDATKGRWDKVSLTRDISITVLNEVLMAHCIG